MLKQLAYMATCSVVIATVGCRHAEPRATTEPAAIAAQEPTYEWVPVDPPLTTTEAPAEDRIDLNTADLAALATLPGIGDVMAERIVAYRTEHGAFSSVDELMKVKGIGQKTFAKLKDFVTVGE